MPVLMALGTQHAVADEVDGHAHAPVTCRIGNAAHPLSTFVRVGRLCDKHSKIIHMSTFLKYIYYVCPYDAEQYKGFPNMCMHYSEA